MAMIGLSPDESFLHIFLSTSFLLSAYAQAFNLFGISIRYQFFLNTNVSVRSANGNTTLNRRNWQSEKN